MPDTLAIETLEKAKAYIKHGWCQKTFATTRKGDSTYVLDPDAVAFCTMGALERAAVDVSDLHGLSSSDDTFSKMYRYIHPICGYEIELVIWNDTANRKKSDVVALLDKAITAAAASETEES